MCPWHIITCDGKYVSDAEFLPFCASTVWCMVFCMFEMCLSVKELTIGALSMPIGDLSNEKGGEHNGCHYPVQIDAELQLGQR